MWKGVEYRALGDPATARELFDFAAAAWPPRVEPDLALGAWVDGTRLVGAALIERQGTAAMLHGPVVAAPGGSGSVDDPLEVAVQLVGAAVDHATRRGVETLFARPQGLDRVWVRFGFIPVPEVALPEPLRGRPGVGLFAYRGGSALWSWREPVSEPEGGGHAPDPRSLPAAGRRPAR